MSYDPVLHGALCHECPLEGCKVVPPESHPAAFIAAVGEAPGEQEEKLGKPFVGPSGNEFNRSLRIAGLRRNDFHITNALLCLTGDSKVRLADGSLERINKLVKDRYDGEVLSVQEDDQIVRRRVVGWHRNPRAGRKLYKVSSVYAKGNPRGVVGPVVTEDHPVLTRQGWKRVKDLTDGEEIAVGDKALGFRGRSVVIGSLLGDGCLTRGRRYLTITHARKNADYLQAKGQVLQRLSPTLSEIHTEGMQERGWSPRAECRTGSTRWLHQVADAFWADPSDLDPMAAAIWYLDDGYTRFRQNRRPTGHINQTKLSETVLESLVAGLGVLGVKAQIIRGRRLYFPADEMEVLSSLIAAYTPPSMQHKLLPEHRGIYLPELYKPDRVRCCWDEVTLQEVEPRKQDETVYCIDVEGTHNFLTSDAVVHNCRPPGNELRKLLTKISKYNKEEAAKAKAEKRKASPMKTPLECCEPRLDAELGGFVNFITMGGVGTKAVTKVGGSILSLRGGLMELDRGATGVAIKVMPTVHPAFVLRQQRWAHVFRNDIAKAARWFRGMASWEPPKVTYNPGPDTLRKFLADPDKVYTYDIETDGIECLTAHIRCIAIGDAEEVMVIGFRRNDRPRDQEGLFLDFYSEVEAFVIGAILVRFFDDEGIVKAGHNAGYYDYLVLKNQMGVECKPTIDTMLLHRNVESELPHSLAYVASLYTEAPSWKCDREGNKLALGGESDEELHEYCATDVAVTARVLPPLVEQVALRDQAAVWQVDQKMQRVCADMHTVGMFVDQEKRLVEERKLLGVRHALLTDIRDRLELPSFNPGSVYQLRDVLFGQWELESHIDATDLKEKDTMTGGGDRSTGDLILRTLLTLRTVPRDQREVIKLIRRYRKCLKVLGTYVVKLRPSDMGAHLGWDDDDDWVTQEMRKKYGEEKRGIVDPRTGRMHPGYNAHVAVTGRLSSSKPINAQNFPSAQRSIVVPQPGHVLVGADMDQVELRIAAALWQVELYLRAFAEGKDPHSMTAFAVFGEEFCKVAGLSEQNFHRPGKLVSSCYDARGVFLKGASQNATDMRNLSKAVQYASQYMAAVETVHQLIQKTELPAVDPKTRKPLNDGTTDLPYARLKLKRVREMRDKWLTGAREFETGWQTEIEEYRRLAYLREPVGGRRRDFLDGEDPNQIVNFKIQSAAAAMMNKAIVQLHEAIPPYKWGPGTGIINQCHDSIVVECPESEAKEVAGMLEECMNQTHPALPGVVFSASADIGMDWKSVG